MIDKASDSPASRIDNHLIIEAHEIVALKHVNKSALCTNRLTFTNFILLVNMLHTPLTLILGNDLAGIFHDDLVGLE